MKRFSSLSNWTKTMVILAALLVLMVIPFTRQLILLILPLGSGIDDLIFFILLALFAIVFLLKGAQINIDSICRWFKK